MPELNERVRGLEEIVSSLRAKVDELDREINGPLPGDRKTIRQRLHRVDNERSEVVRLADMRRRRLGGWERVVLLVIAVWMTVVPTVGLVLTLRGGR